MTEPGAPGPESPQSEWPADEPESGSRRRCDPRCERFVACRPDSPGWVPKKEAALHLKTTLSALRQRAARLGYVSPARTAMPRSDQPKLCLDAEYFILCLKIRRRTR